MHDRAQGTGRQMVVRERLLRDLRDHADVPVTLIVGGAGFGKTVLLDQWCAESPRSPARLRLRPRHDDGIALLGALLEAFAEVEPIAPATRRRVLSAELDWSSVTLPAFSRLLARRSVPCTLVLDDVHFLQGVGPLAVLDLLVQELPDDWRLVLASRNAPEIGVAKLRADGRLWALEPEQLLMTPAESGALLRAMDVELDDAELDSFVTHAEGWPVALYLMGLARQADDSAGGVDLGFAGDDVALAGYLRDEVLQRVDPAAREFLVRTSILEELEPGACDAVLGTHDAARVLHTLAEEQTFVRPLDRRETRFRVHQLLRELLRAELARDEPVMLPVLHRRASEWYLRNGDAAAGVEHAIATSDDAYVDGVVWDLLVPFLGTGLHETVRGWLDRWAHDEQCRRPTLAVTAAWHGLVSGDAPSVRMWTEVVAASAAGSVLPDGSPTTGQAALLRALVGADGVNAMLRDLETARAELLPTSPMWSLLLLLHGHALRILGRGDEAAPVLEEAEALGRLVNPMAATHAFAGLGRLAWARGDRDTAVAKCADIVEMIDAFALDERAAQSGTIAFVALVRAHQGDHAEARRLAKNAVLLGSMLVGILQWLVVETYLDLAVTALLLGDLGEARALYDSARALERAVVDSPVLMARLAEVEQALDTTAAPIGLQASALTPAELRVLRYLPTHLTFGAIAGELYVSRNTVKTQAIAIYRKLGVSSRDAAVAEARRLQLLD